MRDRNDLAMLGMFLCAFVLILVLGMVAYHFEAEWEDHCTQQLHGLVFATGHGGDTACVVNGKIVEVRR